MALSGFYIITAEITMNNGIKTKSLIIHLDLEEEVTPMDFKIHKSLYLINQLIKSKFKEQLELGGWASPPSFEIIDIKKID